MTFAKIIKYMNALAQQIESLNKELSTQLPSEVLDAFGKSIEDLKNKNIEDKSLKVGDIMPDFTLSNSTGKIIRSKDILSKGKMVIAFYRGSWCPYCNLELKYLQDNLHLLKERNTTLVAISPQSPDHSLTVAEKHLLEFEVLTDLHNTFAKQIGITFQLQDFVLPYYKNLGIELSEFNKDVENVLPIPAVFVVDTDQRILYKFADSNYMNRINIEDLVKVL